MTSRPTPGFDHWKNGEPTADNPRYGGTHYEEGKGWCNSQGDPIKTKPWTGERVASPPVTNGSNPNIPAGYTRVAKGVPCPITGSENCVVRYSVDGKPALWDDGDVYMRDK